MDRSGYFRTTLSKCLFLCGVGLFTTQLHLSISSADESLGVRVPEGFEVTLYADDELAHDIYSMAVDSFGRVVVSGAGYIKILHDTDGDGRADDASLYVDGPKRGVQGMYFAGRDLICSGEGGLIRYRDRDGDDRADGPPDLFWRIKTGGEHDLHAIRKGPDGWWYVIAGNNADIDRRYIKLETTPVQDPQAGAVLRFQPDLSTGEVYADGFRNAYDFDFGAAGDVFTFDSDGERDISLPWYRPTRVFHVLPGSHAGWLTRSWKRPDWFFDMPPAVGEFGRGSPTGVECYRHSQFPEEYQGALFVLDWTYGRVFAMPLEPSGSTWSSEPIDFMSAIGQHGFAPTDAAVGPDGSLYISVGGRGTRGGVYRIRAKERSSEAGLRYLSEIPGSAAKRVEHCLQAPQPLSSWSRRIWEPLVAELPSEPFIDAALDRQRPQPERIRAIEILTEKFGGLDGDMLYSLASDPDPVIRARAVWSVGRSETASPSVRDLVWYLGDSNPQVVRAAMEALIGAGENVFDSYVDALGEQLAHPDRYVRQTAMRLLVKCRPETSRAMAAKGFAKGWSAAIPVAAAFALNNDGVHEYPIDIALQILQSTRSNELKLEAVRVLQLGLGDLVPDSPEIAPVFDGYASPQDLRSSTEQTSKIVKALEKVYPTGSPLLDRELERTMSIVSANSELLFARLLSRLTDDSDPVEDLHRLIVLSRMPVPRTSDQRLQIAKCLVNVDHKIDRLQLRQDTNWADRTLEIYTNLVQPDRQLPEAILATPGFGHPGHVQFLSQFPPQLFGETIQVFSKTIREDPDYPWNSDVLFLLSESPNKEDHELIREMYSDFALRSAVISCLSINPTEADRKYFYESLDSASEETLQECISSLGLLSPTQDPAENVELVRALRQLGDSGVERQIRDQIVELLRRNHGMNFNYAMGKDGDSQPEEIAAWTEFVAKKFPEEFASRSGTEELGLEELKDRLASIDWSSGSPLAGEKLFRGRGCIQCHGGRSALGPDLSGVAGRFSREDLFTAIAFPHLDVSPRYQTTQIATVNGKIHTGLIVYESVDGLVLRDSNNRTYRIETEDIEVRRRLSQSLMPEGLLKDLSDDDLSHLYTYLQSLGGRRTVSSNATESE
ncbi:hypothetical protein KOR42_20110 [Thalassoglobus neptunius]|uniref:Cytochrome c domain-containing protein n=1 Tax=Thalassoglobus neptunius TaxID=1938619 RepID=A0A5C5X7J0_9PLAN|nr:PVC-type heme-binding CxxCH protein [Thalassoglobus neptunius]TWT58629.1 hypothetical protein KOR42_20110 [Thalassoglobus neptunius]